MRISCSTFPQCVTKEKNCLKRTDLQVKNEASADKMRHPLIKYGNIALTTTTIHRVWYHLCLLLLVRLGGYIANLSDFYSYRVFFHYRRSVFFYAQI